MPFAIESASIFAVWIVFIIAVPSLTGDTFQGSTGSLSPEFLLL
jgi:hypothetical protein